MKTGRFWSWGQEGRELRNGQLSDLCSSPAMKIIKQVDRIYPNDKYRTEWDTAVAEYALEALCIPGWSTQSFCRSWKRRNMYDMW
jgi:hypothetical protein